MPACPACAQDNPDIARFCLACGTRLAPVEAAQEERRVVTTIFVDLVGFTSRAEKLDPEDVRAILSLYYDRVRADIESFGGVVEKFIGDAVMGLFGAPTSFGDDPERAVRAGLAVLDSVADLNAQHEGLDLETRIAVNTGEALVSLSPAPGDAMVAGDVVNTASRLQGQAPVNGILVGEETFRCTRDAITYEEVPSITAKGKAAPVRAWRVVRAAFSPGEAERARVPLVARARELRILREAWDRVVGDGALQLVTVFGPSGIGKSRLGSEFMTYVAETGARAVKGRSLPYRDSGAYGAFGSHVKQIVGIFESDPPDVALTKLRSTVEELLGPAQAETVTSHLGLLLGYDLTGEVADRESLFFSVRCFIEAAATGRPLLLVFEDLHWADPSLLDLVELLAARLRNVPVFLLVLARPELLDGRPAWGSGLPSYLALTLEPLGEHDSRELAGRLLASVALAERERQAAVLATMAEGNPLFLEQLAATLSERSAALPASLPTTIRGIVTARLDALPAAERSLLVDAAVVGRVFWRGALTGSWDEETLTRLLAALESRDLIHREMVPMIEGEQQFAFKHGMIRDVAYETLPRRRRLERHAEVAQFLEEVALSGTEAVAARARHWRDAGRPERAFDYFVTAAEQAGRGWAKDNAALFYGEAIACLAEDDERRRPLRARQAVAAAAAVHVRDVRDLIRQASISTEESGQPV
ncbi:MAG TPA: AAA family ATPase [Mycobacteriales bacterium]|nr:AAA family ATPase [Mycobacteriales bacterium]